MRRSLALCLVASVLLAGCGGTAPTSTATSTPSPDYGVRTPDGTPAGVNASLVYERVQRLLDVPARANVTVRLADPPDGEDDPPSGDSFPAYLGVEPAEGDGGRGFGVTESGRRVTLYPNGSWSATLAAAVLAHEFVHVLQHQHGVGGRIGAPGAVGMAEWAVLEGAATYVQRAYARRYLDAVPRFVPTFNDSTPYLKLGYAQYSLGERYVEARIDDPAALDRVYGNPPTTTEQLLHGDAPAAEPPLTLSVDVGADGYRVDRRNARGELAVNAILSTELDDERAWHAAAGWGADELVRFRQIPGVEQEGYAWVLRWDSPAEAAEFERALAAFLDERGERVDGRGEREGSRGGQADGRWVGPDHTYRVEPVGGETVVLLVGTDGFVRNATVGGDADAVAVRVND